MEDVMGVEKKEVKDESDWYDFEFFLTEKAPTKRNN